MCIFIFIYVKSKFKTFYFKRISHIFISSYLLLFFICLRLSFYFICVFRGLLALKNKQHTCQNLYKSRNQVTNCRVNYNQGRSKQTNNCWRHFPAISQWFPNLLSHLAPSGNQQSLSNRTNILIYSSLCLTPTS